MQTADTWSALALVVLAGLVWWAGPRSRHDWALDAVTICIALLVTVSIPEIHSEVGQVQVGYGLVLFAVFAAYFRPLGLFLAELLLIVLAYGTGLLMSPQDSSPLYFLVAVTVISTTSLMVAVLGRRLREQALHDSLTGLLNRRGLELMASHTQAYASRSGSPVTVGLIDLDDFKALNDRLGHAAGDRMLIDVSDLWRDQMRRSDLIARYGGDEFAVVLPGTTPEATREIETRARRQLATSWSAGFALWSPDEDLYDALVRADAELYRAKAQRKRSSV